MKKIIKEQNEHSIDLVKGRDMYKCPFLIGAELGDSQKFGKGVMRRIANSDSPKKNYLVGDTLIIKSNYTYDVIRNNSYVKQGLPWKCSTMGTIEVKPQLSADQQRSVDDKISFYKSEDGQPLYQKETPTADQMNDFEKINLKDDPNFKELIKFDYFIWKRKGLRQTEGPQQRAIIKTFTDQGYLDKGGKINPAEEDMYEVIDLSTVYPTEFTKPYKVYRKLESADTNKIVKELDSLVRQRNYGDREFCRNFIRNYDNARKLKAPVSGPQILKWKSGVKMCKQKNTNFLDLNITNRILKKLETDTGKYGISDNATPANQQSMNESFYNSNKILKSRIHNMLLETYYKKKYNKK
jgi:hypothetical protein